MKKALLLFKFLIVFLTVNAQQHTKNCMQGINCNSVDYLPSNFTNNIARSVVRIRNCSSCTGTIIAQAVNNTDELEYLVLTARHCLHNDLSNGGMGLGSLCNLDSVYFTFNFQIPECGIPFSEPEHWSYSTNCTLIAEDLNSDLALLRLNNPPPVWYRPYFAGWSVFPQILNNTGPFYCIHHPGNFEKAIAKSSSSTVLQVIPSFIPPEVFNIGAPFWGGWVNELIDRYYLIWTEGLIQGGSSGAALFNSNEKVIAGLSAGLITPPYCDNNNDAKDFATFGQLMNFAIDHASVRNALDKTGNTLPALSVEGTEILCYEQDLNLSGEIWPASEYQMENAVTINSSGTIYLGRNNNGQTQNLTIKNGSEYYFNGQSGVEIDFIEEDPNQLTFEITSDPCTQRTSQNEVIRGNYITNNSSNISLSTLSETKNISISPNPTSNTLLIQSNQLYKSISIINALGERVLFYNNLNLKACEINVSDIAAGVYTVILETGETNQMKKLIVSKN